MEEGRRQGGEGGEEARGGGKEARRTTRMMDVPTLST